MIPYQGLLTQKLFKLISVNVYNTFCRAMHNPYGAQQAVLEKISANLSNTEYGQYYHVAKNISYAEYANKIPIVNYEDITDWVDRSKTNKKIISVDKIEFFEKTSGNAGPKKYIPYTKMLRTNFSNCFKIWGYDCLSNGLSLDTLNIFMSISPLQSKESESYHHDDSDYLKGIIQFLIKPFLIGQPNIYQLDDPNDFRFILALTLLAQENIEIMSIWSPSYLLVLLSIIEDRFDEMVFYLTQENFKYQNIQFSVPYLNKKRKALFSSFKTNRNFELLWPHLKLISCWTQGTSGRLANKIPQYFPKTLIQGKGLLATEAPITIPLLKAKGYVPLLNDIFLEFEDKSKNTFRVHELKVDEEYEIIISQSSGLYRYRLGDYIRVTHFHLNTPCFEFIGRTADTCDLVGEKLNERFVENIFSKAPFKDSQCLLLVPTFQETGQGKYYLLTDNRAVLEQEYHLDKLLSEAFHYANARKMLQLLIPEIVYRPQMKTHICQIMENMGIKMGNQKERSLIISPRIGEQLLRSLALCKD